MAWGYVQDWLDAPVVWVSAAGPGHRELLGQLICDLDLRGNLVSADSDFARFRNVRWLNPVQG